MGKSPFLMGKSQFLMGKSPLLMGKSPLLIRKSPLLMGKTNITMENHHFYLVNQRTTWPFSIADCNKLPESNFCQLRLGNLPSGKQTGCY